MSRAMPDPTADFDWFSPEEGEEVVWAGRPDKRALVPTFVVGIALSVVGVGVLVIVGAYLRVVNMNYVVTDRCLYRKTGILSRNVQRIDLEKVQNTSYLQTVVGNYLGYGDVDISTAGTSGVEVRFWGVRNPKDVQALVSEHLDHSSGPGRSADEGAGRTTEDVLAEILEELRAIRAAVDGPSAATPPADERGDEPSPAVQPTEERGDEPPGR